MNVILTDEEMADAAVEAMDRLNRRYRERGLPPIDTTRPTPAQVEQLAWLSLSILRGRFGITSTPRSRAQC